MKSPLWAADWAVSCIVYGLVAGARTGCCFVSRPSSCLLTRLLGWAGLGWGRVTLKPTLQPSSSYRLDPESSCSLDTRHRGSVGDDGPQCLRVTLRWCSVSSPDPGYWLCHALSGSLAPAWPWLANLLTLELMPFQTRSRHHRHLFRFPWAADTMYTMRGTKCGHNLISVDCCANKHYCSVTSGNKPRIMVQWWPCWQHPGGTH